MGDGKEKNAAKGTMARETGYQANIFLVSTLLQVVTLVVDKCIQSKLITQCKPPSDAP